MVFIFYAFFRNVRQATIFLCLCYLLFTNSCDWDEYFSLLVTCYFFNLSTRLFRPNRLHTWCYPLLPRRNATKSSFVWLLLARLASQPAAMEWDGLDDALQQLLFCGFISRLSTFSRSCVFRCQLTFSLLTGKGHAALEASGKRCLHQVQVLIALILWNLNVFIIFFFA